MTEDPPPNKVKFLASNRLILKQLFKDFYGGRFNVAGMTHVVVSIPQRLFAAEEELKRLRGRLERLESVNYDTMILNPNTFTREWLDGVSERLTALELDNAARDVTE